ncbi:MULTISPECIES: CdaR family transcriptional regulator [unclassified Actinoplanes]|uniref:PucR family transcriptional regulator n=1 Tax=unclassified Actinoplanes TaxID=2626549 RepID=UPI0005BDF10E|nr:MULTISPECIES: PucR family transcriptional regulator [unclassified Actinoplanes]SLM00609.1 transcriptional regulator [Actinoplanes sp. SE50/110]
MVQSAAEWPVVSPRVAELFRQGAQAALDAEAESVEAVHEASLSGDRMRPVADDPVLVAAVRRSNVANLRQWTEANVRAPGRRVPANLGPEVLETARDMVRRGLDQRALDSYRTGQSVAWRRWMRICFALDAEPDELRALLDVSSLSISTFIEDTITAVSARMEAEHTELTRGAHAERRAAVSLLLEGAPISRGRAEAQLGYRLTGPHTAAIVWTTADTATARLEAAAEALTRAGGATHRLTVLAGAAALWLWLPVAVAPRMTDSGDPDVRVAIGRPGADVEGFRRSHLDALATQRMLTRLTSPQRVAHYADIQLAALLTIDPAQCAEFLADTLGGLLHADAETRETVATYVREQCNTLRTADRLFTHRNTVVRRLARADALLPRPLADNVLAVAAALEILRWRG